MIPDLSKPMPISQQHNLEKFHCGEKSLDEWLQRRAMKNEVLGASRTFVSCIEHDVVAYYSLAAGSVDHRLVSGKIKRNMPDPIPVMILARLAIAKDWQGKGLGYSLLKDALLRSKTAAEYIGARAILVHALSDDARQFYEHFGFRASPVETYTLMLLLSEI